MIVLLRALVGRSQLLKKGTELKTVASTCLCCSFVFGAFCGP